MQKLINLLQKAISLTDDVVVLAIDTDDTKQKIVELNQSQLYNEGINAKGEPLGQYKAVTKKVKIAEGARNDHITLSDTFTMYASEKVEITDTEIVITMDTVKGGKDLRDRFGEIVGLTGESQNELSKYVEPKITKATRNYLT